MAQAYMCLDEYIPAEAHAVQAFTIKRDYVKAYYRAAKAAAGSGNFERAFHFVEEGIRACSDPTDLLKLKDELMENSSASTQTINGNLQYAAPMVSEPKCRSSSLPRRRQRSKANRKHRKSACDDQNDATDSTEQSSANVETEAQCASAVNPKTAADLKESDKETRSVSEPRKTALKVKANKRQKKNSVESEDLKNDDFLQTIRSLSSEIGSASRNSPSAVAENTKEKIKSLVQGGSELLEKGLPRKAAEKYEEAYNILSSVDVQVYGWIEIDYSVLRYALCWCWIEGSDYRDIVAAINLLITVKESHGSRFPAVDYAIGAAYCKLNRYKQSLEYVRTAIEFLNREIIFEAHPWPGTNNKIKETTRSGLQESLEELYKYCNIPHRPDAVCRYSNCLSTYPHIIPSVNIYYSDPDFSGLVIVTCQEKCRIHYHLICWKNFKEKLSQGTKLTDKDMLGLDCPTADCEIEKNIHSLIIKIEIFGEDASLKTSCSKEIKPVLRENRKWRNRKEKTAILADKEKKKLRREQKLAELVGEALVQSTADNSSSTEDITRALHALVTCRERNFGFTQEDCWNPNESNFGRENVETDQKFGPPFSENDSEDLKNRKDFLYTYFVESLNYNGPLKINYFLHKVLSMAEQEIYSFLLEYDGPLKYILTTCQIVILEDTVCLSKHLAAAYKEIKNELHDSLDIFLSEEVQKQNTVESNEIVKSNNDFGSKFLPMINGSNLERSNNLLTTVCGSHFNDVFQYNCKPIINICSKPEHSNNDDVQKTSEIVITECKNDYFHKDYVGNSNIPTMNLCKDEPHRIMDNHTETYNISAAKLENKSDNLTYKKASLILSPNVGGNHKDFQKELETRDVIDKDVSNKLTTDNMKQLDFVNDEIPHIFCKDENHSFSTEPCVDTRKRNDLECDIELYKLLRNEINNRDVSNTIICSDPCVLEAQRFESNNKNLLCYNQSEIGKIGVDGTKSPSLEYYSCCEDFEQENKTVLYSDTKVNSYNKQENQDICVSNSEKPMAFVQNPRDSTDDSLESLEDLNNDIAPPPDEFKDKSFSQEVVVSQSELIPNISSKELSEVFPQLNVKNSNAELKHSLEKNANGLLSENREIISTNAPKPSDCGRDSSAARLQEKNMADGTVAVTSTTVSGIQTPLATVSISKPANVQAQVRPLIATAEAQAMAPVGTRAHNVRVKTVPQGQPVQAYNIDATHMRFQVSTAKVQSVPPITTKAHNVDVKTALQGLPMQTHSFDVGDLGRNPSETDSMNVADHALRSGEISEIKNKSKLNDKIKTEKKQKEDLMVICKQMLNYIKECEKKKLEVCKRKIAKVKEIMVIKEYNTEYLEIFKEAAILSDFKKLNDKLIEIEDYEKKLQEWYAGQLEELNSGNIKEFCFPSSFPEDVASTSTAMLYLLEMSYGKLSTTTKEPQNISDNYTDHPEGRNTEIEVRIEETDKEEILMLPNVPYTNYRFSDVKLSSPFNKNITSALMYNNERNDGTAEDTGSNEKVLSSPSKSEEKLNDYKETPPESNGNSVLFNADINLSEVHKSSYGNFSSSSFAGISTDAIFKTQFQQHINLLHDNSLENSISVTSVKEDSSVMSGTVKLSEIKDEKLDSSVASEIQPTLEQAASNLEQMLAFKSLHSSIQSKNTNDDVPIKSGNRDRLVKKLQIKFPIKKRNEIETALGRIYKAKGHLSGTRVSAICKLLDEEFEKLSKKHETGPMGMEKFGETAWVGVKETVVWSKPYEDNVDDCAICMEPLSENLTTLPCNHVFHKKCVHDWFAEKCVCPICQAYTTTKEDYPPLVK